MNDLRILFCAFLFSAYLFGCDTPQEIGVDLQPEDQLINTLFTDTMTVKTELVTIDSVRTDNAATFLVGSVQDPDFGNYEAQSFFKINMGTRDSISFLSDDGEIAKIDSVVFILALDDTYGDTTQTVELGLFPLLPNQGFEDTVTYYQFNRFDSEVNPIVTLSYPEGLTDDRRLRVFLDSSFIADNITDDGILFNEELKEDFEQFVLRTTSPETSRSILSFNRELSRLVAYYSFDGDTSSSAAVLFLNKRFTNITYDFSEGSPFPELADNQVIPTNGRTYVQAGTGITTRVTFPNLKAFLPDVEYRIHRAELRMLPVEGTISEDFTPPASLFLFRSDEEGNIARASGGSELAIPFEGVSGQAASFRYNTNGQNYGDVNITQYLQRLLDEETENNGIILGPTNNESTVRRAIFQDGDPFNPNPIQLRVYYTIVQ
ncbi:MAG: DUF4270 family protein [Bacteroidota bacterium]